MEEAKPTIFYCVLCGKECTSRCAACSCVTYCSGEHQSKDWKFHKQDCRKLSRDKRTIRGIRIDGDVIRSRDIVFDSTFVPVPIAHAAGIPLFVKRCFEETPYRTSNNYMIVRFMSRPETGLADRDWQYGPHLGPAPPCLLVRTDGKPFLIGDWALLDDFEDSMLYNGPRKVSRVNFMQWVFRMDPEAYLMNGPSIICREAQEEAHSEGLY